MHPWCKDCKNAGERKRWPFTDKDEHRGRIARWRAENPERARDLGRSGHARNRVKRNAASIEYRKKNPEKMAALGTAWAKANPAACREIIARRRSAKRQATPAWANDELEQLFIKEAYHLATLRTKLTGIEWHVDHVVPLKSERVCGLHCMANLEVIPASVNHAKNNYRWPDMAEHVGR
jgi:hypothetical protein